MSSNPQPQWAVLHEDDGALYDNESAAQRCLSILEEGAATGYAVYRVTPQASSAERSEEEVCRCAPTPSAIREDSAVYIRLSNRAVNETVSHYEGTVNVDMDDYDAPVGVEILGAVEVTINGQVVGLEYE